MKTSNHPTEEMRELAQLIDGQRIAMLTTLSADGELESRPMTVVDYDADGRLWLFFEHDPQDGAARERHRRVNLSFSNETNSTFVSLPGRGEIVQDLQTKQAFWGPALKPWFPDGPESPRLALLKITPERAEYWTAPHSRLVRRLALALSVVAGRPVGLGEHGVLRAAAVGRGRA
jgi:general stress protein 26